MATYVFSGPGERVVQQKKPHYAGALTFTADTYLVTVMAIVGASQTVYQVLIKATRLKAWVDGVGMR